MKRVKVSNNVIRRLPRYLRKLDELSESGVDKISSRQLGDLLGLTSSQVRQDFNCFGEFGQQGYGYNIAALRTQIAGILGMERGFTAILVGVGNIGRAMMENFCFSDWGVNLAAAFDIKPALIGTEYRGVHIYSMDELEKYLDENKADIAVLTVPKTPGKKPAILRLPGAAVRSFSGPHELAYEGFVILEIGVHGIPIDQSPEIYRQLENGALAGYTTMGIDNRDTYYYKRHN